MVLKSPAREFRLGFCSQSAFIKRAFRFLSYFTVDLEGKANE